MESGGSPWSTPTQSEIADTEAHLKLLGDIDVEAANDDEGIEGGLGGDNGAKQLTHMIRELGDGEPSSTLHLEQDSLVNQHLKNYDECKKASDTKEMASKVSTKVAARGREPKGLVTKKTSRQLTRSKSKAAEAAESGYDWMDSDKSKGKDRGRSHTKSLNSLSKDRSLSKSPQPLQDTKKDSATRMLPNPARKLTKQTSLLMDDLLLSEADRNNPSRRPGLQDKQGMRRDKSMPSLPNGSMVPISSQNSDAGSAVTRNSMSTAATDKTSSSNSSGAQQLNSSPRKSPQKKLKCRGKDVLQLPKPYNSIKSDMVKHWNAFLKNGTIIQNESEAQMFKLIGFTNALVLKMNQLAKQGLLDRKTGFSFACNVARFVIPAKEETKCLTSFYQFARELSAIRDGIKSTDQKDMLDLEMCNWIPPTYPKKPVLQQTLQERPQTAKPRDPDSYEFKDEAIAKDYRKLWNKYQQMEALLKQKSANPGVESDDD